MIRNAVMEDLPALLEMGAKFFSEAGYGDLVDYDNESTSHTLKTLIQSDTGLLVVSECNNKVIGMAGGMVFPFYFNHNHITGQEFFWWLQPEYRGGMVGVKLFKALEDKAKTAGARTFSMIALDSVNPEIVGRIYSKRGYRKSEHTYIRSL